MSGRNRKQTFCVCSGALTPKVAYTLSNVKPQTWDCLPSFGCSFLSCTITQGKCGFGNQQALLPSHGKSLLQIHAVLVVVAIANVSLPVGCDVRKYACEWLVTAHNPQRAIRKHEAVWQGADLLYQGMSVFLSHEEYAHLFVGFCTLQFKPSLSRP